MSPHIVPPGEPLPQTAHGAHTAPFTLRSPPGTTIWSKPSGNIETFNAPHRLTPAAPFGTFSRARVTISGAWHARHDNAGLLLLFTDAWRQRSVLMPPSSSRSRRHVCAGVGLHKDRAVDQPLLMSMSCESDATDWSLHPRDEEDEGGNEVTVEVRVQRDVAGTSLWVYYLAVDETGAVKERHPMRELSWMFADGWETNLLLQVGVYCAMPAFGPQVQGKELEVRFSRFQVEWLTEDEVE